MQIKPYTDSDKLKLIDVFKENIPQYFHETELNEFINYLDLKKDTYLVIEKNNELIGGLGYEIRDEDKSGRINWIFLTPKTYGKGIGKKAVEYCIEILEKNPSVETLIVRTSQFVYPFFEKLGYKIKYTEKDYWAKGFDLYLMEKMKKRVKN